MVHAIRGKDASTIATRASSTVVRGVATACLALFVGCSSAASPGFQTGEGGVDSATGARLDAGGPNAHGDGAVVEGGVLSGNDATSASSANAIVYGQSGTLLFAVNPDTKALTTIGNFSGCDGAVIDIALDKNSTMYATTFTSVYTIDTTTAACHLLASAGSYPNSLSFVPAGTLDPTAEALVGYDGSTYVRIDTTTGKITSVGSLGGGPYTSSGDIVSVIGGGTYLTVTGGSDCSSFDCLVEVDPTTGAMTKNYGSVSHQKVFGVAFWAGSVFGFDNEGDLFEVTFPSSGGIAIADIPIPNEMFGRSFNGAGSTTSAPPLSTAK